MGTKGIVHMGFNYTLAENISRIFSKGDPEAELATIGWVWGNDAKTIFNEIIEESPKSPLIPQKRTLLHCFIGCFLRIYLEFQNYNYIDQCFPSEDPEYYTGHLDDLASILLEYQQEVPDYKPFMESLVSADETGEPIDIINDDGKIIESHSVHELYSKMIDDFMERIECIQEEIENATFYLLFKDKNFLYRFNYFLRPYIQALDKSYFEKNGGFRRCPYLPQWLKTAIMYRDNGCCQLCGKNLTGAFDSVDPFDVHFDHIIPLIKFGTNDPSNFQILCQHCNEKKGEKIFLPQYQYMLPWEMDDEN